jgi:hypothetical protein
MLLVLLSTISYPLTVNRLDLVISLATRLGIHDLDIEFELRPLSAKDDQLQSPLPSKMTYWLALTSYLAIQRVPQPAVIKVLQQYTSDPEEVRKRRPCAILLLSMNHRFLLICTLFCSLSERSSVLPSWSTRVLKGLKKHYGRPGRDGVRILVASLTPLSQLFSDESL